MPDIDLDQLLHQTRPPAPAPGAVAVARELAARAGRAADPRRSGRRRRATPRLVAAAVTGAVLLSGATTLAAHQLRIPPFQTVPAGIQRLEEPVPIDVVEPDGTPGRCLVYLELAAVDAADLDRPHPAGEVRQECGQRVLDEPLDVRGVAHRASGRQVAAYPTKRGPSSPRNRRSGITARARRNRPSVT